MQHHADHSCSASFRILLWVKHKLLITRDHVCMPATVARAPNGTARRHTTSASFRRHTVLQAELAWVREQLERERSRSNGAMQIEQRRTMLELAQMAQTVKQLQSQVLLPVPF